MIKFILLPFLLLGLVSGRPQFEKDANILRSESDDNGNGDFHYSFDTSNNIGVIAAGRIKNPEAQNPDDHIQEIVGCYSYIDSNGEPVVVTYIADENGYQPTFTSLQTCPDLNTLRGGVLRSQPRQPAAPQRLPAPAPAPQRFPARAPPAPAPVPQRPRPTLAPIPVVRTTTPQADDGLYRVIDEQGNVVAVLPKNTNLVG